MKALDTNILVRFLVRDDVQQANKVIQLFTKAEQYNERLYISLLVILELIWLLQSAYRVSRQDILLAINDLLQMQVFEFENQVTLREFINSANNNSYDLSDTLISQTALSASCETTLTFDKKASQFELFTLLE